MGTRNPTEIAECGCPFDPVYDKDSLGWHLTENHLPEAFRSVRSDLQNALSELGHIERALEKRGPS
jgi:hypothetical protein